MVPGPRWYRRQGGTGPQVVKVTTRGVALKWLMYIHSSTIESLMSVAGWRPN